MADKKQIVIIDDEEDICSFTKSILERTGVYEVGTAVKAQNGIDLVKEKLPDMIILDVNMPDMDGGEVARALREYKLTSNTPILFLTGLMRKSEAEDASGRIGKNFYMAKPVIPAELIKKIESILAK
ncbi:MAG: response regulator [Candidatus Omnitrophica bacterium]|jgi:two-component system alkaline phosphatase synthesis response regulator PhoP|nr:response regulator [Candidatus Omnitrophota bacterium]MDD5079961.1 response regulator [Candidatus Omnitrophota bacterium]